MLETTTHVGMDVHKKDIAVAMLIPGETEPIEWTVRNDQRSLRKLVRRLERDAPGPIEAVYEAGPCGYTVQRQIRASASPSTSSRRPWCRSSQGSGSRRTGGTLASWPWPPERAC